MFGNTLQDTLHVFCVDVLFAVSQRVIFCLASQTQSTTLMHMVSFRSDSLLLFYTLVSGDCWGDLNYLNLTQKLSYLRGLLCLTNFDFTFQRPIQFNGTVQQQHNISLSSQQHDTHTDVAQHLSRTELLPWHRFPWLAPT